MSLAEVPPLLAPVMYVAMIWAAIVFLWHRYKARQAVISRHLIASQLTRLDKLGVDPEAQSLIDRMQLVAHLEPEDMEWLDAQGVTWHRGHGEEIDAGTDAVT